MTDPSATPQRNARRFSFLDDDVDGASVLWGLGAVSLALTSAVMVWLRAPHPPAGATTLIVSLGILREPDQLAILMLAVVVLTVQGLVINRLAGIDYPYWRVPASPSTSTGTKQ